MEKFLYGVSTAAFQIEGDDGTQGRGKSVWDSFCDRKDTIENNANAKVTVDHYNRYQEDIQLMAELGVNSYRFSTSWSRLFPQGIGRLNDKGVDFYDRLIDGLLEKGITPFLTLYHWDLPQSLSDRGGFQNPDFPKWFAEYSHFIATHYGDRVKHYCTFNEPINAIRSSYYAGVFAPGHRLNEEQALWCMHHMHLAHAATVEILHKEAKGSIAGVAMSTFEEYPTVLTPQGIEVARKQFFEKEDLTEAIDVYMDPMYLGKYPQRILDKFKDFAEQTEINRKKLEGIQTDCLGFNTYSGCPLLESGEPASRIEGVPTSTLGSIIDPNGLYWGTKFLTERYAKPLFVMENGIGCADWVAVDGKVHDAGRVDFLQQNLKTVEQLREENIDIQGYFVWSLMDNFEWLRGYSCRFGLVYVDYETLKRTPKDSYYYFQKYLKNKK